MSKDVKRVSLVGAGPGDENLLTLKAASCIEKADVIIYDNLINPGILNGVKKDAKLIYAGKVSGNHFMNQDEINRTILSHALKGEYVVRLKGGDPYIFGRGGEEAEYLLENNVDFEVVHGVSSFYSCLGYAGIPITHRDASSSFHVFTGHKKQGEKLDLDFEKIAGLEGSLVFLMAISNISLIVRGLCDAGMDSNRAAAVIENGSRYNQRVFRGDLSNIVKIAHEKNIISPAILVIGEVCKKDLSFFNVEKSSQKNILLTATRPLIKKMSGEFKKEGFNVCEMSLIDTEEIDISRDEMVKELEESTHIIFTSANGADIFFKKLREFELDIRALYNKKICVIGSGSKDALKKYGLNADFIPSRFNSETFLQEILPDLNNKSRVSLFRAKEGNDVLPEGLKKAGIKYRDIAMYKTIIDYRKEFELNRVISKFDYVVAASGMAARALWEMVEDKVVLEEKIVSIGPVTTREIRKLGLREVTTASKYNVEGIIDAIKKL